MSMRIVRQPAVAGRFYPGRGSELEAMVDGLLADARAALPPPEDAPEALVSPATSRSQDSERPRASRRAAGPPKALIVPHAGYVYSGPTAARGYVRLEPLRDTVRRVVLLGPAHYVAFRGLALPEADAFATPLGELPVDRDLAAALAAMPQVVRSGRGHVPEHSLEVQLPFLQRVLDAPAIVPLVVGDAGPDEVGEVIDAAWGDAMTLVLVSSDLSHYLPYAAAEEVDAETVQRILDLDGPLPDRSACGARAINGLLVSLAARGLRPVLVDRRNSGDTAGDRSRVVGYASFTVEDRRQP